jgi:hypothetical protein
VDFLNRLKTIGNLFPVISLLCRPSEGNGFNVFPGPLKKQFRKFFSFLSKVLYSQR